jgi:hypothetical protein
MTASPGAEVGRAYCAGFEPIRRARIGLEQRARQAPAIIQVLESPFLAARFATPAIQNGTSTIQMYANSLVK